MPVQSIEKTLTQEGVRCSKNAPHDSKTLQEIGRNFQIEGEFLKGEKFGSGHINDTYLGTYLINDAPAGVVFQRINERVFTEPKKLMENIERVTTHLFRKSNAGTDSRRSCLRLIPAKDGTSLYVDKKGDSWRAFRRIEGAGTYDTVRSAEQAFEAGAAFGRFQRLLIDLPEPRLHVIIPDFHNTEKRYYALENAIEKDAAGRVKECGDEISFAGKRRGIAPVLNQLIKNRALPERIAHNDTKLNNVMIDDVTGKNVCVIDLDTVMPGTVLSDFGDLVRTATCPAAEDEKDLNRVTVHLSLFEALVKGYASEAHSFLTGLEIEHLVFSGKLITYEQGIRFLTDYLNGDPYYKTNYGSHNLDRCRSQFKLIFSIEEHEGELERIIGTLFSRE